MTSSVALVGFGLDSVIEVGSAAIVAWQFTPRDARVREERQQIALRVIASAFLALSGYVWLNSALAMLGTADPQPSRLGIVLAMTSLLLMPGLSYAQRQTGRALGSQSAVADSRQTMLCAYLSAATVLGLVLNVVLDWGWADPVAGLVIAVLALREGIRTWDGETWSPATEGRV